MATDLALLRDVSLIVLAFTTMLLGAVPVILLCISVYGLAKVRRHERLPNWLRLVQAYLGLAQAYVELAMAHVARPLLAASAARAALRGWTGALGRIFCGGRE